MRTFGRIVALILLLLVVFTLIGGLYYIWALARGREVKLPSISFPSATPSANVITSTPRKETPDLGNPYPYPGTEIPAENTPTPTASPVEIPNGWTYYEDPNYQIALGYPADWLPEAVAANEVGVVRLRGADGFLRLAKFDGPGSTLDQACEWEANHDPTRYGETPELHLIQPHDLPGCEILTSLSAAGTTGSALVIEAPQQVSDARFLVLNVDPVHLADVSQTLKLAGGGSIRPEPTGPVSTVEPGTPAVTVQQRERDWNGLLWTEYGVALASEDTPVHIEFDQRVPKVILEQRDTDRAQAQLAQLDQTNNALASFGYRIEASNPDDFTGSTFTVFQGDQVLVRDVFGYQPVAVSQSGSDFRLVLDTRNGSRALTPNGLEPWDIAAHDFQPPVYLGDDLLSVSTANFGLVQVVRGEQVIYSYSVAEHPVESPVRSLSVVDGHWVLLVNGMLIVDGQIQNQALGYDEIFGWQLLNGQPFYFFVQKGRVGAQYGDQANPGLYDTVIHDQCCEPAAFNILGFPNVIWYYAQDGGEWYLVRLASKG